MYEKHSPFFAFRYLISPSKQTTLFPVKNKEILMIEILRELINKNKTVFNVGKKKFIFYGFQTFKSNIFIYKFVKEIIGKVYLEGEKDVQETSNTSVKYVYVIIDSEKQIVLIERNVNVFSDVFMSSKKIESYFGNIFRNNNYSFNIRELTSPKKFWTYVDEADEIYELTMTLNAPNLFHGDENTRSLLNEIKSEVNNDEILISLKNNQGYLILTKQTIGQYIKYIQEVGGKYFLRFKKDGIKQDKTSLDDTTRTSINKNKSEKYDDQELVNIQDKINLIHNSDTREQAETDLDETIQ